MQLKALIIDGNELTIESYLGLLAVLKQCLAVVPFPQTDRIQVTGHRWWLRVQQHAPLEQDKPSEGGFTTKCRAQGPPDLL